MNTLQLSFVTGDPASYLAALAGAASSGKRKVLLRPWGNDARAVVDLATRERMALQFFAAAVDGESLDPGVSAPNSTIGYDAIFLFHQDPVDLSAHLLGYLDSPGGHIVAPKTAHYFEARPLFLISIPKSGTHLVYELVSAFGYSLGGNSPDNPSGGVAYFINSMNPHTTTSFLDFKDSSFNLYHPFIRCPALFSYRNPLDIVVSEANYYHKDGKSAFWSYLSDLSFDGRVRLLINDPYMLGSIRNRIMPFVGWLGVKNVIPVSYEELVGARGGGSEELQTRLIWSLQLKLHIPGDPRVYANRIYSDKSPTFSSGQLGSHRQAMSDEALRDIRSLPQDFIRQLGYLDDAEGESQRKTQKILLFSKRTDEFRRRPLVLSSADVDEQPIMMLANFCEHNIMRFQGRYIAVPQSAGPLDLAEAIAANPDVFPAGPNLQSVQRSVLLSGAEVAHPVVPIAKPGLLQSLPRHNIVLFRNTYFVVPKELGPINLELEEDRSKPGIQSAETLIKAVALAGAAAPPVRP